MGGATGDKCSSRVLEENSILAKVTTSTELFQAYERIVFFGVLARWSFASFFTRSCVCGCQKKQDLMLSGEMDNNNRPTKRQEDAGTDAEQTGGDVGRVTMDCGMVRIGADNLFHLELYLGLVVRHQEHSPFVNEIHIGGKVPGGVDVCPRKTHLQPQTSSPSSQRKQQENRREPNWHDFGVPERACVGACGN